MADPNTRRAARRKRKRNTRKRRANRKLDRLHALRARLLRGTPGRGAA